MGEYGVSRGGDCDGGKTRGGMGGENEITCEGDLVEGGIGDVVYLDGASKFTVSSSATMGEPLISLSDEEGRFSSCSVAAEVGCCVGR
jgi:hypothetical protein